MSKVNISVVLGTYQRLSFLKQTLRTIREELSGIQHEIIVVDGGSTDGTIKYLINQKDVILIVQHNRGKWMGKDITRRSWGYFMNLAFKAAHGKYVCMLSDDCLVIPGAILNGMNLFEQKLNDGLKLGSVAFYWRNWGIQKQYMVGLTMGNMYVNHGLYLNAALKDVNYIDEDTYAFYHADGDLCLRMLEKGWLSTDCKKSFIEHFPDANIKVRKSNVDISRSDWNKYSGRWKNIEPDSRYINLGDWLYIDHHDLTSTYKNFPKKEVLMFYLAKLKNKVAFFVKNFFI